MKNNSNGHVKDGYVIESVFDTIKKYSLEMPLEDAIGKVERDLSGKLPERLLEIARREMKQ